MNYKKYTNFYNFLFLGLVILLLLGGLRLLAALISFTFGIVVSSLPLLLFLYIFFIITRTISKNRKISGYMYRAGDAHNRFVELLIHLLLGAAKADGEIKEKELLVIQNFFKEVLRYDSVQIMWIQDLIAYSQTTHPPLEEVAQEFNALYNEDTKLIALQLIYRVIFSDHVQTPSEKAFVERVAWLLSIPSTEHEKIRAMFVSTEKEMDPFAVLGLTPAASKEDIKKAYKEAVHKYHPDKAHHLGDEFRKVAEQKMQKINEAYHTLIRT